MNTSINTSFRSPLRTIDLTLLRSLCEHHPWPLKDLCKSVDMDPSILSNVFSGRRPLPTRYAKDFLELVGLNTDSTFNMSHAFVFVEKQGRESDLSSLLNQIYPDRAGVVLLSSTTVTSDSFIETKSFHTAGRAFFDGKIATVVHGGEGLTTRKWETRAEFAFKDYETANVLLSTNPLPKKLDVLKAFTGSKSAREVTWQDVQNASVLRNLAASDVLEWVTSKHSIVSNR